MNEKENKFLTLELGEPWFDDAKFHQRLDFSSWQVFGRLWEYATKQEWWLIFLTRYMRDIPLGKGWLKDLINPDRFADAIYQFLKERK